MMAVRPYSFEPTRRTSIVHVEDSADDSDIEEHESPPPESRLGHTLWCSCVQCIPQATERELEDVLSIFSQELVRLTCIVDHPEFATVCLNPLALRVALAGTIGLQFWLRRCVTLNANEISLQKWMLQTRAFSLMGSERPSASSHCEHSYEYAMK